MCKSARAIFFYLGLKEVWEYRDLSFLVCFGLHLWMYASQVVYPVSQRSLSGMYKFLLLNPMTAPWKPSGWRCWAPERYGRSRCSLPCSSPPRPGSWSFIKWSARSSIRCDLRVRVPETSVFYGKKDLPKQVLFPFTAGNMAAHFSAKGSVSLRIPTRLSFHPFAVLPLLFRERTP